MIDPNTHPSAPTVKTLGVVNIVVAALGLTIGMCCMDLMGLLGPAAGQSIARSSTDLTKGATRPIEKKVEAIKEQEEEAKTDEEKTALRRQRLRLQSQLKGMNVSMDVGAMNIRLDSPFYVAYYVYKLLMGVMLNILLLVAGIGLLRYADWARKLSVGAAIARIAHQVVLSAAYLGFLLPYITRQTILASANSKSPMMSAMGEMVKTNRVIYTILDLVFMGLSMIYPIVLIVLLNLEGTKRLCRAMKPRKESTNINREFE